jgi:hypothetical protein
VLRGAGPDLPLVAALSIAGLLCAAPASGQTPADAKAGAPACQTRSVVLRECPPVGGRDTAASALQERVERNARQLEKRAELSPAAVDLGSVLIEESRVLEPTDVERFRETLTRKDYLLGRQTYAGMRGDRDNFGTRFECGQSFDLQCANQPGRPASTHWMDGH